MRATSEYTALITPFFKDSPNYTAMIAAVCAPLSELQAFLASVPPAFDLDQAIGAQLDIDGLWIGRSRVIRIPIPPPWFSFDDTRRCFDRAPWYVPGITPGNTYTSLDDDTYRRLLRAKIAANFWDGTAESAQEILNIFFSIYSTSYIFVEDCGDMSMSICVAGSLPNIVDLEIIDQDLIPLKPQGVALNKYVTSVNGDALFGFDVNNVKIKGFDAGAWGVSPDYAAQNLS